jgi:hypothetical protein
MVSSSFVVDGGIVHGQNCKMASSRPTDCRPDTSTFYGLLLERRRNGSGQLIVPQLQTSQTVSVMSRMIKDSITETVTAVGPVVLDPNREGRQMYLPWTKSINECMMTLCIVRGQTTNTTFNMKHRMAEHHPSQTALSTGILPNATGQQMVQQVQSTSAPSAAKSLTVRFELQNGIVPANRLLFRYKNSRAVRATREDGMVPDN